MANASYDEMATPELQQNTLSDLNNMNIKAHHSTPLKSAISTTLMINELVDLEWKFGVTASSSESDRVGNTFVQLKMVINTGSGVKNVHMELSLPQFYSFLHEMEKAKSSMERLG